jgi:hypothetical protein
MSVFLANIPLAMDSFNGSSAMSLLGPLIGLAIGVLIILFAVLVMVYIYLSLAFMSIGKKAGLSENTAGLAWIPFFGPLLISYLAANMHWWTWILTITLIIPFVNFVTGLIFIVYTIIWGWKMFTAVGKPGWWSIVPLIGGVLTIIFLIAGIPSIGIIINLISALLYFVFIGIAAWSSQDKSQVKYI